MRWKICPTFKHSCNWRPLGILLEDDAEHGGCITIYAIPPCILVVLHTTMYPFLVWGLWLSSPGLDMNSPTDKGALTFGQVLSAVSLLSSLARLQTNKHEQSLAAHMVIRISSPGLGYVLLHHRPIRGLGNHRTWWYTAYDSESPQSFWMQPLRTCNKPQQCCGFVLYPLEMCWPPTASCNRPSDQTAETQIWNDIRVFHWWITYRENGLHIVNVFSAWLPLSQTYAEGEQHLKSRCFLFWFSRQAV